MRYYGMSNDSVSSVKVPYGYSVKLFRDDSWSGDTKIVNGSMFLDDTLDMPCISVSSDF